jgi:uncharacterized protein YjbJ (UPF0337 family)
MSPRFCLLRKVDHVARPAEEVMMDKDRIKGVGKEIAGSLKEAAGKVTGDTKLTAEGKAEKLVGKVQNAAGKVKDAARGK